MPIALAAIVLAFVALFGFSRIAHAATEAITVNTVRPDTYTSTNIPYEDHGLSENGMSYIYKIPTKDPLLTTDNASNLGATSVQLNAYYDAGSLSNGTALVSFEYGTDKDDLEYGTTPRSMNYLNHVHNVTINGLQKNTRYYYRAVARYNQKVIYGQTNSFTTGAAVSQSTSNTGTGSSTGTTTNTASSNGGTTVSSSNAGTGTATSSTATASANVASSTSNTFARLTITDNESTIERGDRVTYTVTYEARQALRDATLTIELPKGMTVLKSSRGNVDKSDRMVVVELGNPSAGSQRTITIDARMNGSVRDGESLKATAELQFETVSGSIRSLSATDTTEFIGGSSVLGASLFGTGVSLSFFNWLVVAGIIAVIIILARKQFQSA